MPSFLAKNEQLFYEMIGDVMSEPATCWIIIEITHLE